MNNQQMTPQTKTKTDWRSRPEMQKLLAVAELSEKIFWAANTTAKMDALIAKWRHKGLGPNPLAMAADWEARSQIFGWGPHPKKNNDKHDATQQGERVTQQHAEVLREVADLLGATSFEDRDHLYCISRGHEWHLFVKSNPKEFVVGVHIPSEIDYDTRESRDLQRIRPCDICIAKTQDAKTLADAIRRRLLPAAAEYAATMWRIENEMRDYQRASADNIARAAKIIGAPTRSNILHGKIGRYLCTARVSGAKIELSFDNLDADQLAKIAAVLDAEGDIS